MKTILVPTGFSETSRKAALYAVGFALQTNCSRIVLYNAYEVIPVADPSVDALGMEPGTFDLTGLKESSEENLKHFKASLLPHTTSNIELIGVSEYGVLARDIKEICMKYSIDAIIMGVTDAGKLSETIVGSASVDVARHADVPVIIVPPDAELTSIKQVMLACNFEKVTDIRPAKYISDLLESTGARMVALNIDHEERNSSTGPAIQVSLLEQLMERYKPEYFVIDNGDFVESINHMALEKKADLIITIPKKAGWFDGLFKKNHTKALAFHSHVPLMVINE